MNRAELAGRIDHTLLRPGAAPGDVERHCREALQHGFRSVCLHTGNLRTAAAVLQGSPVLLCGVISFPHGATTLLGKIFEALEAIKLGAAELDVVLDLGAVAAGDRSRIDEEVRMIMDRTSECRHKFIVETGLFDPGILRPVLGVMNQRRPAFVKTSTGVNARGATVEDVRFLRGALHASIGVKASGGIRSLDQAIALLDAGASVLGTSAGVGILRDLPA